VRLSTRDSRLGRPVQRAASAHVLAADSDYSLVKEQTRQKGFRVSCDTLATALAMALVRLPTISYPASLSRLASRLSCVSRCWVANLIASFSVVNHLPENSFRRFREAVKTPPDGGSRCIGGRIIGSLTDLPHGDKPAGLFLIRVRKKKTRSIASGRPVHHGAAVKSLQR
jgi:hypothetical protein